ncbi:MAG: succinate dehydrogenase [Methanosphaera sp. rholeuAM74]|nr:MAG: succinate dehydrogenase [Methanosphaera sp. rholeuAM74]
MITVNVKRYDPVKDEKYLESYEINESDKMKVLDALQTINEEYDANIAYRYSCRAGQCGSCAIKINGEAKLACKAEINDNDLLEPLNDDVIKDLIVDRNKLNDKTRDLNMYLSYEDERIGKRKPDIILPTLYEETDALRSCIGCYSCLAMCPVLKKTSEFAGPYFMRGLSSITFDPRGDESRSGQAVDSGLYCCTSCGKCSEVCPKEINIYGKAIEIIRARAVQEKEGPLEAHKKIHDNVKNTGKSVGVDKDTGYEEGFAVEYNKTHQFNEKPKIAFFTGCMINNKLPWIAEYLVKILNKLGYEVDIPQQQVCCGSPLLRTGQTDIIQDLVDCNYETFKEYDIILTVCAGCGATLKNNYPEYGAKLNVMDISEFLEDKLNPDDMKEVNLKVTYHDPCHLARSQNITFQPRNILNKIKGLTFVEMDKPAQCCGAGGGVKSGKSEIAEALADEKVEMIDKLDVDHVVTICPFCEYNIQDSLTKNNSEASVINLMELLNKAYD